MNRTRRTSTPLQALVPWADATIIVVLCLTLAGPAASETPARNETASETKEVIAIDRGDEEAVQCTLYRPPHEAGEGGLALIIHLYGHSGSHRRFNLRSTAFDELRQSLWDQGHWVLVPELGPRHWMNDEAVARMDAVIDAMVRDYGVDPAKVSLIGTSMGGGSSLVYAAMRPERIRSVVAVFPMTDFVRWAEEEPRFLPSIAEGHDVSPDEAGQVLESLSVVGRAEAFEGTPIMLIHGEEDTTVLPHHTHDLWMALHRIDSPVVYRTTPDIGHKNEAASPYQGLIVDFLDDPFTVIDEETSPLTVFPDSIPTR